MFILIRLLLVCFCFSFVTNAFSDNADKSFSLSSSAFLDQGVLPVLYTCDGKDLSPQIAWVNTPAKTKSLALIASDPNTAKGTLYHWILFNIPSNATEVSQGMETPIKGAIVGKNDFDKEQYNGPCPPKGSAHSYVFTVYALDTTLPLKKGMTAKEVLDAIKGHVVGQAKITAVYSRWILE